MAKQVQVTGYYVVVTPDVRWSRILGGPERVLEREKTVCNEIVSQIKRHVDDVESAWVAAETDAVCEHCGAAWTEDGDDYNGGCCAADEDAHLAATAGES